MQVVYSLPDDPTSSDIEGDVDDAFDDSDNLSDSTSSLCQSDGFGLISGSTASPVEKSHNEHLLLGSLNCSNAVADCK